MKRTLVVFLASLVTAVAFAQPPPQADLGIVKIYRPAGSGQPAAFIITVTNYGPAISAGFTVTDQLPPGPWGAFTAPPPWTCTASLICTYNAQLSPGNSAMLTLPINVTNAQTNIVNCATVKPLSPAVDTADTNNTDCACIDVNPCRDVTIDITTGQQNGLQLAIGVPDTEWLFGATGNTPSTTGLGKGTPTPPPGRYITDPAAATGTLVFRFNFTLGSGWRKGQCRVILQQFRADNCVSFHVDTSAPFAQTTPAANCFTSAGWTVPGSGSYVLPSPAGSHTLTATLTNNEDEIDLYVRGSIVCLCKAWPGGPPFDPSVD